MFIEYVPHNSCIHKLDIRTKLLGFTCIVILNFLFDNPLYNLAVLAVVCVVAVVASFPFNKIAVFLLPLAPVFLLIMLFSAFTPPERFVTPLYQKVLLNVLPGGGLKLTVGGILQGCTMLVRLVTMVIASSVITLTSPIDDFVQLLNKLRVPYEYSFAITTALRFIPTMNKKRQLIILAQKARGAKVGGTSLRGFVNNYIPIMVPLMVNSIRMTNSLTMAMLNRGFGYSPRPTILQEISFQPRDYVASTLIVLITSIGIYLRIAMSITM